jgi:hypothetical protein
MVTICNGLLEYSPVDAAEVDSAIRIGDVFALLVEYHQTQQNFAEVFLSWILLLRWEPDIVWDTW